MKQKSILTVVVASCFVLGVGSCGDPTIPFGQTITGTLTSSDPTWQETDSEGYLLSGYYKEYEVDVVAGRSYTVTFGTNTGHGNFEDEEHGLFHWGDITNSAIILNSNPQTATWVPSVTGLNRVDVDAQVQNVPLDFTIEITEGAPSSVGGAGSCTAWRQTTECSGSGPREPQNDQGCDVTIKSTWSGYCECSTGNVKTDCTHALLTCDDVCTKGEW